MIGIYSDFVPRFILWKTLKGTEQADSLTEALTGSLGSGLFGRLARLARPDGVAGQDPKLILHPGTQVYYRRRQLPASDGLRNWQKKKNIYTMA